MAITGPVTSSIALKDASFGDSPFSMCLSTFSKTTIASSTTMPIASTRPKSVSVLMEKLKSLSPANVPIMETGTARHGMSVALQFCRKRKTTRNTRSTASKSVFTTSSMETRTNVVVSYGMSYVMPSGNVLLASLNCALTSSHTLIALAPGARVMPIGTAGSVPWCPIKL